MTAICAYISAVWAGTENPLFPHLVLIPGSVLAGMAVGVGIVFERPKCSEAIQRIGFWCVVVGIAVECVCTVFLFVVDERISHAQEEKIIALETRLLPWQLKAKEFREAVNGQPTGRVEIMFVRDDPDCRSIAFQIDELLVWAHWDVVGGTAKPIPYTDDSKHFFGESSAMSVGGQPTGVSILIGPGSATAEEGEAVENWRAGKPWKRTPFTVLLVAMVRSLGYAQSGGARDVVPGTIRIVVAPRTTNPWEKL